ncbi:heme-dependent oxidative N-demethylase family protein [Actinomycetes bacterium M1A6_2h]
MTASFPYPFDSDTYRSSVNVEPARTRHETAAGVWGNDVVDVGSDYQGVVAERAEILRRDPRRHAALPHMREAKWDALRVVLAELARSRPDAIGLDAVGSTWTLRNDFLGTSHTWVDRDDSSLPLDPLVFAAGHIQEDVVLLDRRDGRLFADAGVVTFAADWSMNFDLGMPFMDIHRPVPRLLPDGVAARAQSLLLELAPGQWMRRTNWSTGVDHRLDMSAETRHEWKPLREQLFEAPAEEVGRRLSLRVEVQHLTRTAPSGAVLFLIRTHMLSLNELASVPGWAERFVNVIRELPDDIADYKGLTPLRPAIERWWSFSS